MADNTKNDKERMQGGGQKQETEAQKREREKREREKMQGGDMGDMGGMDMGDR